MERLAILAALLALALVAGLSHDPPPAPQSSGTRSEPGDAGPAGSRGAADGAAALAADPRVARCVGSPVEVAQLPRIESLDELVVAVSAQMAGLRELTFERPVDARFLSSERIEARIGELIAREESGGLVAQQGEVLRLLGAIPAGTDLAELSREALSSQVAGLYVPRSEELLVRADGRPGALEVVTLAHELEHALADQALGVPLPDRVRPGRGDSLLARQAIVEGDATLAMSLYQVAGLDPAAQLSLLAGSGGAAGVEEFEALPDLVQRQLLFPYLDGLRFVCDRYLAEGWRGVDALYEDPPESSAAILFPGRREIQPLDPPPLGRPGEDWRPELGDELGAAPLLWLLQAPGGEPGEAVEGARAAAAAWRGGFSRLWRDARGRYALSIWFAAEGNALCEALGRWYPASFGSAEQISAPAGAEGAWRSERQAAVLDCGPGEDGADGVRLGIAPRPSEAEALAGGRITDP